MKQANSLILNNKIETIFCDNTALNSINIGFYFKCGIIYETLKNNGISHLVEHLFFRNLDGISQEDLYFKMESIGTTLRAKTYSNFICFDMTIAQKHFEPAVEIMLKLLNDFEWTDKNLKDELSVVKKQIEFASNESFSFLVNNNYFKGTKLSKSIMGTINSLCNLTVTEVNAWKKTFFNPNNVCCVLTGGFSQQNLEFFLEKLNSVKSSKTIVPKRKTTMPRDFCNRNNNSDIIVETEWEISDVSITFDIDASIDICCVNILSSILGEGVGSKLSIMLREKMALTDEIYSKVELFPDVSRLTIEFSVYNRDIEKSLNLLFDEIIKFKNNITQNDLLSAIVFFTDNQEFIFDSPRECNFFYGWNNFVLQKREDIYHNIQEYKSVTIDKLADISNQLFVSKNMIVTVTNNQSVYDEDKLRALIGTIREQLSGGKKRTN